MLVRYALRSELEKINSIRRTVNDLHVEGRPDIFRVGFNKELENHIYTQFDDSETDVIAALIDGEVCGFAMVTYVTKPLSPYNLERRYYNIVEFGVDPLFRRRGVGTALIEFCRNEAQNKGLDRIELDMWEFNETALKFYESVGFSTYRRYMEMEI